MAIQQTVREIWFQCKRCGKESYCGPEFARMRDPEVMCPFCHTIMKLQEVILE